MHGIALVSIFALKSKIYTDRLIMSTSGKQPQLKSKPGTGSRETTSSRNSTAVKPKEMAFGKMNYMLTIAAFALVVIGFMLMTGGTEDPFSFRKITLAPIIVLLGFGLGIYAIFFKDKKGSKDA